MVRHSTRPLDAEQRNLPAVADLPAYQRARRQKIVDAARQLLIREDYGRIQVKDAAEAAGVSLGTLYRYFNSKDHLFACALVDWGAPVEQRGAAAARRSRGSVESRVRRIFHRAARAFEDTQVYGALMQLGVSNDRYAAAEFQRFARQETAYFKREMAELPERYQEQIVTVLSAVLSESLRGYARGKYPMAGVYERLDQAIDLIFRTPFETDPGSTAASGGTGGT